MVGVIFWIEAMKCVRIATRLLIILILSIAILSCGIAHWCAATKEVPLSYVGEIVFHKAIKKGNTTRIPVSFSGGEWNYNSGRVFKTIKADRYEFEIHITVVTCLAGSGSEKQTPEICLKNLVSGKYQIIYHNPDGTSIRLKPIEI